MTTHRSLIAIVSASVDQTGQLFYHGKFSKFRETNCTFLEEKIQLAGSAVAIVAPTVGQVNESLVGRFSGSCWFRKVALKCGHKWAKSSSLNI